MKTQLPTFQAAAQAVLTDTATPLDTFIYEEQPIAVNEEEFRENLTNLLAYFDKQRRHAEHVAVCITAFGGAVGIALLAVIKQLLNLPN